MMIQMIIIEHLATANQVSQRKTGYSKFGSYKGKFSTDGTFVYTGFKPAFDFS